MIKRSLRRGSSAVFHMTENVARATGLASDLRPALHMPAAHPVLCGPSGNDPRSKRHLLRGLTRRNTSHADGLLTHPAAGLVLGLAASLTATRPLSSKQRGGVAGSSGGGGGGGQGASAITSGSDGPIDPRFLLTAQQEAEVRGAFYQLDKNRDGTIPARMFARGMLLIGLQPRHDEIALAPMAEMLLSSIGVARNSMLNYGLFEQAMAIRILQYDAEEEVRQAFRLLFRSNRDGVIDTAHVRELLTTAGDLHLSDAEVDELLALADPSGSGHVTLQRLERLECWYRPNQKL